MYKNDIPSKYILKRSDFCFNLVCLFVCFSVTGPCNLHANEINQILNTVKMPKVASGNLVENDGKKTTQFRFVCDSSSFRSGRFIYFISCFPTREEWGKVVRSRLGSQNHCF